MNVIITFIKRKYLSILFTSILLVVTLINIGLRAKLMECENINRVSSLDSLNYVADSFVGFSLNEELFESLSIDYSNSKNNVGCLIFTKPKSSCGKCLIEILSVWNKNIKEFTVAKFVKPVIILEQKEYNFINMIASHGYLNTILIKSEPKLLKKITAKESQGVLFYVNKNNKIIFAAELQIENINTIKNTFLKIIRYTELGYNI